MIKFFWSNPSTTPKDVQSYSDHRLLTEQLRQKSPVAGKLSNGMVLINMATPHEVLRYMGLGQKSLGAVLERFSEICPFLKFEFFHL